MSEMSARYELLYIIPTTYTDDELGAVEGRVAAVLEKHGAAIESTQRMGKLRFAYPIKNQRHGHYVLVYFAADRANLAKLEGELRITPEILRHLIVRADETSPKFEMVQFQEVNLDLKEDKPRRKRTDEKPASAEASSDEKKEETLTSEQVDEKIESALKEDGKDM